jgi:LAO/AO transport system kinase
MQKQECRVIGFSGPPGVGKSTFVEKFGLSLCSNGKKVAVLAVDPSSPFIGGSILADKTRMQELSVHPNAFIRPSPNRSQSGGLHHSTRDVILACKAAGFDEVLIETVGAGQSEVDAAFVSDLFISLYMPGTGDSMQAIKKGLLEASDIIVVHKADGDLKTLAENSAKELSESLSLRILAEDEPQKEVTTASSITAGGHEKFLASLDRVTETHKKDGHWQQKRDKQNKNWIRDSIELLIKERYLSEEKVNKFVEMSSSATVNPHKVAGNYFKDQL